jgi:hypothetical protein
MTELEPALEVSRARAECVRASGFTTREAAVRRQQQRNRRSEERMEAWRRNRPNAIRKTARIDRRGRMFFWP